MSFALRLLNRQRLPSTRVVREFADPYSDDEVSEGYERVQGTWKENPITEESEQIVVSFLPVFHGLLDGLVDAIPVRIVPDWLCRHPLVESDHEGVHRDSDQNQPESAGPKIGYAECQHEAVREHEKAVPDRLDLGFGKTEVFEYRLNGEAKHQEPPRRDSQLGQRGEAATRSKQQYGDSDQSDQ